MASLTRRAFLMLAALLAPAARVPLFAQGAKRPAPAAISIDEFLRLSQRLVSRPKLDPKIAATYLNALVAVPTNVPLLMSLARGSGDALTPALVELERTIIECWFTGTYTLDGERRVATHTGALMWAALGMPAPGTRKSR